MPAIHPLHGQASQVRQGRQKGHAEIALAGNALEDRGQPETEAIIAVHREEVAEGEEEDVAAAKGLPNTHGSGFAPGFFFPVQLAVEPVALFGRKPLCFARPVREAEERNDAEDDGGNPLEDEEPAPAAEAEPG